jgi:hypothetical protein
VEVLDFSKAAVLDAQRGCGPSSSPTRPPYPGARSLRGAALADDNSDNSMPSGDGDRDGEQQRKRLREREHEHTTITKSKSLIAHPTLIPHQNLFHQNVRTGIGSGSGSGTGTSLPYTRVGRKVERGFSGFMIDGDHIVGLRFPRLAGGDGGMEDFGNGVKLRVYTF